MPSVEKIVGLAFLFAMGVIVALGIFQYRTARRLEADHAWLVHTEDVLRELQTVRTALNRAEASAQSYAITGDPAYRDQFDRATDGMNRHVDTLRGLTADNASQQQRLGGLGELLGRSSASLKNEMGARKSAQAAAEFLPYEDSVREANQRVRDAITAMQNEEFTLLQRRREAAERSNRLTKLLIILGSALAFVLVFAAGVRLSMDIAERRRAEANRQKAHAELQQANQDLENEISERRQAELKVQASEQALRRLSVHLIRSRDEERRRIGRELHDSVGQLLTALALGLETLKSKSGEALDLGLRECADLASQSIREVRTMSYLLYPPMLEDLGLKRAVPWYLDGYSKRSGLETTFQISENFGRLPTDVEIALFRVLQESITNVHRHSGGNKADVRLEMNGGLVALEIRDYGKGIESSLANDGYGQDFTGAGVGLRGMSERLRELGGKVEWIREAPGTKVRATIPFRPPTEPKAYA
jgi:signal transduction histidine kinase